MMTTKVWTIVGSIYLEIYSKTNETFNHISWKIWLFLIHHVFHSEYTILTFMYERLCIFMRFYIIGLIERSWRSHIPIFSSWNTHNSRGVKTLSNACMCVSVMSYNYEASSDKSLTRHTCQHLINRHQTKTPEDQTNKWIVNRDIYWYRDSFSYLTQES